MIYFRYGRNDRRLYQTGIYDQKTKIRKIADIAYDPLFFQKTPKEERNEILNEQIPRILSTDDPVNL